MLGKQQIDQLAKKAMFIDAHRDLFPYVAEMDVDSIFDLLVSIEEDKQARDKLTDGLIEFNDEIVSIELLGEQESMDISVTGDNLFYANGILTKNSFGLPATADFMFALISTDELEAMNQLLVKQLKNRYNSVDYYRKFVVGIDRSRMRIYDTENSSQSDISDSGRKTPDVDSSPMVGKRGKLADTSDFVF